MRVCACALVIASCARPAPAQTKAPDPKQLLKDASDAMKGASAIIYAATVEGIGAMAASVPTATAQVTLARTDPKDRLGWRFSIDGRQWPAGQAEPVAMRSVYDGAVFRAVHETDRTVMEGAGKDAAPLVLTDSAIWVVGWALRWQELVTTQFDGDDPSGQARYEGRVVVDGVVCRVVRANYADMPDSRLYGAWWYLAESDSLPRRVELHYYDNDKGDGFARITMGGLRVVTAPPDAAFAWAAPAGFVVKKYEPPAPREDLRRAARGRPQGAVKGSSAPDWALKDPAGKEHKLSDYKGRIVLMDFWATWCGPCQLAMPGVQKIHERYKDMGVTVLGVNAWESGDAAAFMKQKGYTYGLLLNADEVAAAYGVTGIPAFFVVGPDGTILFAGTGYSPEQEAAVEKVITDHLADVAK
jgi:peroxiredoxin